MKPSAFLWTGIMLVKQPIANNKKKKPKHLKKGNMLCNDTNVTKPKSNITNKVDGIYLKFCY